MENYHIIIASYLPATNTNPSRIKLFSGRYCDSVIIPYQSESTPNDAINYLKSKDFDIIGKGWNEKNGDNYIISTTFKSLK
jgi:hypothetical protein